MPARYPRAIVYQGFERIALADGRDRAARVRRRQLRLADGVARLHRAVPGRARAVHLGGQAARWRRLFLRVEQLVPSFGVAIHSCIIIHTDTLVIHREFRNLFLSLVLKGQSDNLLPRLIINGPTPDNIRQMAAPAISIRIASVSLGAECLLCDDRYGSARVRLF